MMCPACGGATKVEQTIPANKRTDGRHYRIRRCADPECNATHSTLECMYSGDQDAVDPTPPSGAAATAPDPVRPRARKAVAIPTAAGPAPVYDLEGGLELGLPSAVECIIDAVRPGTSPDRTKIDVCKWLIEDRRRWRIQMAEQANRAGETPADPAMAQLANILRLVPDEAV